MSLKTIIYKSVNEKEILEVHVPLTSVRKVLHRKPHGKPETLLITGEGFTPINLTKEEDVKAALKLLDGKVVNEAVSKEKELIIQANIDRLKADAEARKAKLEAKKAELAAKQEAATKAREAIKEISEKLKQEKKDITKKVARKVTKKAVKKKSKKVTRKVSRKKGIV